MGRLQGKVAVITAGGQTIGRGIAMYFAKEGAKIVIVDGDQRAGETIVAELNALPASAVFLCADLGVKTQAAQAIATAAAAFGRIDILIIGAEEEPQSWQPLESKSDAALDQALGNDVHGALWTMQAAFPHLRDAGGGAIVMLFSNFGECASRFVGEHMAARWGALGLARTAGHEWGRYQIRVNTLVTFADTPAYRAYRDQHKELSERRLQGTAMQRAGDPELDIGGAALFLASDDCRYVTGQVLYADGGQFMTAPVFEPVFEAS